MSGVHIRIASIFRANVTRVALLAAGAAALVSSVLYLKQGGFGGGHGSFDPLIFVLGQPWDIIIAAVPDSLWPSSWLPAVE